MITHFFLLESVKKIKDNKKMEERSLCVSGGGAKAVTLLGLLYEIHARGQLDKVNIFSGCSAGAFICALYIVGINPIQQLKYFPQITDLKFDLSAFQIFIEKVGMNRIQKYTKKFRQVIEDKIGIQDPTLKEFYEATGKTFYISAVNTTKCKIIYFNHKDYPDIKLFDAIHASAALPGVFIPVKIKGSSFIDGGYYNSFPLEPLVDTDTIGVCFSKPVFDDGLFGEMLKIAKLHIYIAKKEAIKRHPNLELYECTSTFGLLDLDKTKMELLDEFNHGRQQHPQYYKQNA